MDKDRIDEGTLRLYTLWERYVAQSGHPSFRPSDHVGHAAKSGPLVSPVSLLVKNVPL